MKYKNKNKMKQTGRPSHRPDSELLSILLNNHTSSEIGYMFGVSDSTVRSWVHRDKKTKSKKNKCYN